MKFTLPNIYTNKNLKFFIAIPIAMMLISIYLSQGLILDSSLSGGESIILQTHANVSSQQLSSALGQQLHVPDPTVQSGGGQVQITIDANKSLSDAENYLIAFYSYNANYTQAVLNNTNYKIAYQRQPSNQTIVTRLAQSYAQENLSYAQMNKYFKLELASLSPFIGNLNNITTDPNSMAILAQNYYTNASTTYEASTMSGIRQVIPYTSYSYQQITVQQSGFFLQQLETIIIAAFILISIVVFFIFRSIVPSFAVVFGAANDIIVALGAMALFHIPLGIASIGGLLMLLGYSIDTDVLTAIRIIKRHEGTPEDRAYGSMKTGLTMTATAIVSFAVLFIVSLVAYVPTYYEIAGVVLFGLIGDVFTTWLGNASMILLYMKRKEGR
jgi:preprotein translocase subunit SecF